MEEDKKLYNEFLNGNEKSFEKLIKKYEKNLIYFITRYVKNVDIAEDIYQSTMLYILENKEQYDFKYSFKTYMYLIAKSRALNYLKQKQNRGETQLLENTLQEEKLLEEAIFSKERQEKIRKVILKMKEDYQLAIYLTKIEGLSYLETSVIMDKTEKQIKNLVYNATKKLRGLLIKERIVEFKNNKIVKLLLWILIVTVTITGVSYAGYKIYEKYKAKIMPTYNSKINNIDENQVWIGTFNLAWNEFINQRMHEPIKLEGNSKIVEELNKQDFTKKELSEESYYITVKETKPELKEKINSEIQEKFKINETETLNKLNFKIPNSYTIYSLLYKKFEYIEPFDRLEDGHFNNSKEKVKYFGIDKNSKKEVYKNLEILYFKNKEDFAVKLNTKNNEEIILTKNNSASTFKELYQNIITENSKYKGNREFQSTDKLKIPYLKVNTEVSYNDLCNKKILNKNSKVDYIVNAIQSVKFNLNEKGGELESRGTIQDISKSENINSIGRNFEFTDEFVLFLKEKDKQMPYFVLKVNEIGLMEIEK